MTSQLLLFQIQTDNKVHEKPYFRNNLNNLKTLENIFSENLVI